MSTFWGLLFFCRKKRRRPPGSAAQSLMVRTFHDFKGFKGFQRISDAQSPRGSSPRLSHAGFSCGKSLEPFPGTHGLASRRPRPGSIPKGVARLAQVGPNLKNGLIGPLTAPNEVSISSPSGKFRGGAKYGPTGNRAAGAKGGRRPTLSVILGWAPSGAQPKITQGGRRPT